MRFIGPALIASAFVLSACSGGANNNDTAASAPAVTSGADSAAGAATGTSAATGGVAAAPITGTTHEVKMYGDEKGYRFDPATVTIKEGDGIKFTVVSGGPHNVGFDPANVPDDVEGQLSANMPDQPQAKMGPLESPMLMNPGDSYTISFANVKPGTYPFHCTPHLAMGMKGTLTIQ